MHKALNYITPMAPVSNESVFEVKYTTIVHITYVYTVKYRFVSIFLGRCSAKNDRAVVTSNVTKSIRRQRDIRKKRETIFIGMILVQYTIR